MIRHVGNTRRSLVGLLAVAAITAGCSSDGDEVSPTTPGSSPVATTVAGTTSSAVTTVPSAGPPLAPPTTPAVPSTGPPQTAASTPPSTSSSPPAVVPLEVVSAAWNEGLIELSDGAPTQDWGVAAAPTVGGPYPVALLLHGNHPTCPTDIGGGTWPCPPGTEQANHAGLTYLAEALASRGFVAIAPGINVQYTLGAGEPATAVRTAEIADRALTSLEDGLLGVDAAMLDTSRLVLVGHSVGGQDAGIFAAGNASFARPVAGVVLLQPALNDAAALPLVDVPAVVVLSECDGDTGVRGGDFVATALRETRQTPAAVVVIERANHNYTNTGLRTDAFPVESPACDLVNVLTPEQQQAELAQLVPEFALAVLAASSDASPGAGTADGAGAGWAGDVFAEPVAPEGFLLGVVLAGEPVASVPGPGPMPPADLESVGITSTFCPAGYYTPFAAPGSEPCHRPELPMMVGYPQTVAASWDASGASLTVPVTAAAGQVARLRVLADFADERLTETLVLRLSSTEGASTEFEIPLPEVRREEIEPFMVAHGLAMWSTITLPLPDGATGLTVEVLSPSAGSMQILSLGVHDAL